MGVNQLTLNAWFIPSNAQTMIDTKTPCFSRRIIPDTFSIPFYFFTIAGTLLTPAVP